MPKLDISDITYFLTYVLNYQNLTNRKAKCLSTLEIKNNVHKYI